MLDRQTLFILVIGLCIVNGIFSPYLNLAIPVTAVLLPELFPKSREWVLFFSSIVVSTTTLFFSGVPAALWERLVERDQESPAAHWIWLGVAVVLTLPAIQILRSV